MHISHLNLIQNGRRPHTSSNVPILLKLLYKVEGYASTRLILPLLKAGLHVRVRGRPPSVALHRLQLPCCWVLEVPMSLPTAIIKVLLHPILPRVPINRDKRIVGVMLRVSEV